MNIDILNEAIGGIDASLVEEALADGEKKPKVTAFTQRPWLKWAAAAVAIAVIAAGTPLALKAIGSFRNENFVAPNGSGNSGVVVPVDSSESDSGEPESGSESDSENNASSEQSGESRPRGSEAPGGSSAESPDDPSSSSGTPSGSDVPEQPEGDFVKDNMPAVTYRINGEYKTFDYQSSTAVVDSGSSYVIDRYADAEGNAVSVNADFGYMMQYWENKPSEFHSDNDINNEEDAVNMANIIAMNTDIALVGIENADTSVRYAENKYYVTLSVPLGKAEMCFDIKGELKYLIINKYA